ncbi:MAG: hypothetical protein H6837_05715 [Planctomycetes bacterium]|nr:hypothetical protein [Planctomycetota bacterium]
MKKLPFLLLFGLAAPVCAQIETEDPKAKIQEILDNVANEMKEIDKLLQESGRSKEAAKSMKSSVQKLDKLLDQVGKSQGKVVKGIDELLEQAEKMKGEGGQCPFGGESSSNQKKRQKGQQQSSPESQQDQGRRQRERESREPRQLGQKPGEKPGEKNDKGGKPENNQRDQGKGQNATAKSQPKDPTGKADAGKTAGAWGELPDYILKHGRGSMPAVPDKYRKYLDALSKQGQQPQKK